MAVIVISENLPGFPLANLVFNDFMTYMIENSEMESLKCILSESIEYDYIVLDELSEVEKREFKILTDSYLHQLIVRNKSTQEYVDRFKNLIEYINEKAPI